MLRAYLPHALAACTLAAGVCLAPPCRAAKVKTWHQYKHVQYDKAKLHRAALSNTGTLRLARRLKPLAAVDATHVWAVAEDRAGNLFAATGDEGKIYKIDAEGKAVVAYTSAQGQVLSLAAAADGSIYAGTGPAAQIVRIDPRGQAKVFCELPESYVWSLAVDPKTQAVYAGTGPKGRIYRITLGGKHHVFYETKQDHVLCLAAGPDGTLYAGTDKTGRVLRIDPKGKGFVLYQAAQSEVRTLLLTADALYAGTSSPTGGKHGGSTARRGSGPATARVIREEADPAATKVKPAALPAKSASRSKEPNKTNPAPPPSAPGSGDNSVYRIAADGAVREVFRAKAMILSLLKHGKHLYVGTGMDGQLFEINEAMRERSEIARLDHGQILGLHRRADGSIVVAAGDPGKLFVLQDGYTAKGTVTSDVLDAGLVSKWGALRWRATMPGQTRVTIAVRSGNVDEPDETWSDWSAEQDDAETAVIAAPTARFLQYRVTLSTADPAVTPAVRSITLRYTTTNQAPEVTRIDVPDLNAITLENPKKLKIKWSATDANEDDLTYRLYVRKDGWESWVLLEEDLEKTDFEWDSTTTPSGIYRVKVVASDRKDNPEKEALTGERVSAPFVVCHAAPAVTLKAVGTEGRRTVIEATASSPLARLTAAAFAVNGKKWVNVFPTDGLFDSKAETFRFKTGELKPGTYVLVLKVKDAAGNVGSADVVFSVPAEGASARK